MCALPYYYNSLSFDTTSSLHVAVVMRISPMVAIIKVFFIFVFFLIKNTIEEKLLYLFSVNVALFVLMWVGMHSSALSFAEYPIKTLVPS